MLKDSGVRPIKFLRILGAVTAVTNSGEELFFSVTQRRFLARLAVAAPGFVHRNEIIETVWGEAAPRTATQALHNQLSRIRAILGEESISTGTHSYSLNLPTDADLVLKLSTRAEELIDTKQAATAFKIADEALALRLGDPLCDIDHTPEAEPKIAALSATFEALRNTRLEAAILTGRKNWALHEAELLAGASPHDEKRVALLAQALMMHGRRADALSIIAQARRKLRIEIGIEEGKELAEVEEKILNPLAREQTTSLKTSEVFAGRTLDLRLILGEVARRRPVLVSGEPGIGVSRLLIEVRKELTRLGLPVILLKAEEYPYSPVSMIAEALDELGVSIPPGHGTLNVFERHLKSMDKDEPVVLIIDDAHFIGPSIATVLENTVTNPNVRIILGAHGTDVGFNSFSEIPISGIDAEGLVAIAQSRGSKTDKDILVKHSGGNPAMLISLLESLEKGAPIPDVPEPTQELTALAERLIASLSYRERRDVLLAAVAGSGYPRAAFSHIQWPWKPDFPTEIVEWTAEDALKFRHEAVRTTLYASIPRGQLLEMHYVLGLAAKDSEAPPIIIATHLYMAAELDPDTAISAIRYAAEEAARYGAHGDSVYWLQRALEVDPATDPARTLAIRVEYADELRLSGNPEHFTAALNSVQDSLALQDENLIAKSAFTLLQLGASSPAGKLDPQLNKLTQRVIKAITDSDRRALVQAAASLAWSMTGKAAQCRRFFNDAEASAVSDEIRRQVLPFAYLALGMPADLQRRRDISTELLDRARSADDPVAYYEANHLRFAVCLQEGDGSGARQALAELQRDVELVGDVGRRWQLLYCSASMIEIDGDSAESERLAEQAYLMFAPVAPERAAAAYYTQLLPLRIRQGRLSELLDTVSGLVESQPGIPAWHAAYSLILAKTSISVEDALKATKHAALAFDLVQEDFTWLACHVIGGRAAVALKNRELAEKYLTALEPWADLVCWQGTCSYGPVATVLALLSEVLGDAEGATEYANRARTVAATLQSPGVLVELNDFGF
ncbi:MAG TPA: BTAD domain-containing putative transcriptional regulator [Microbacteriaceae bacterium]|nr:BTAD domain-containing putative transcriptional regulator [Microbacteriaceae bacterium]